MISKETKRLLSMIVTIFIFVMNIGAIKITAEDHTYQTQVDDNLDVSVNAQEGVLPEGTKLEVTPVDTEDTDGIQTIITNKVNEKLKEVNKEVDVVRGYLVQYKNGEDQVIPDNNLAIKFDWKKPYKPKEVNEEDEVLTYNLYRDKDNNLVLDGNQSELATDETDKEAIKYVNINSDKAMIAIVAWVKGIKTEDTEDKQTIDGIEDSSKEESTDSEKADGIDSDKTGDRGVEELENEDNAEQENEDKQIVTENDEYKVSITYGKEVTNIPNDAEVKIHKYNEDDEEYKEAKDALIKDKSDKNKDFDESTLDLQAINIAIQDSEGNEIEPDGYVDVELQIKKVAEDIKEGTTLEINHIKDKEDKEDKEVGNDNKEDSKKVIDTDNDIEVETVAKDVKPEDGVIATFKTDSFSTYTVDWVSKGKTESEVLNELDGKVVAIVLDGTPKKNATQDKNNIAISNPNGAALTSDAVEGKNGFLRSVQVETGKIAVPDSDNNLSLQDTVYFNSDNDADVSKWKFTKADNQNGFYIESVNSDGTSKNPKQYLNIASIDDNTGALSVTGTRQEITVTVGTEDRAGQVCLNADGKGVNLDNNDVTSGYHGWHNLNSNNSFVTLYGISKVINPLTETKTLDNNALGINIKMFDYKGTYFDGNNSGTRGGAIEQKQYLPVDNNETVNFQQGLVQSTLNEQGYPITNGTKGNVNDGTSLQPLFSNSEDGSITETDANHLFSQDVFDKTGFYEYSSFKNFAHLNTTGSNAGNFTVYNQIGTPLSLGEDNYVLNGTHTESYRRGNFLPYNDLAEGQYSTFTNTIDEEGKDLATGNASDEDKNRYGELLYKTQGDTDYYFGMQMDADFIQPENGVVIRRNSNGEYNVNDMVYEFNGDDDLWVYVDNVLLLDIGGIHGAIHGKIDFKTGIIHYYNGGDITDAPADEYIADKFRQANVFPDGTPWEESKAGNYFKYENGRYTTFLDYTSHHMKMFYMERGAGASDLHMRFNIQIRRKIKFVKTDEDGNGVSGVTFQLRNLVDNQIVPNVLKTSDATGLFTNGDIGLYPGEYELTEVSAPPYLEKLTEPIRFTFDGKGIQITSNNSDMVSVTGDSDVLTLHVKNRVKYALPSAGGIGTKWYTYTGFIIVVASIMMLLHKHKQWR